MTVLRRVAGALREAARDARRSWGLPAWLATLVVAALAAAPATVLGDTGVHDVTAAFYVILAAIGLNLALGLGGMPSLGQGAFVVVGAFAAALLRTRAGWDPVSATLVATVIAAAAGVVLGGAAVRLRPALVAVATWVGAWLVGSTLAAFPGTFGGAQGVPLPPPDFRLPLAGGPVRFTPGAHYALGLALVVLALLSFRALSRGGTGRALAAVRAGEAVSGPLGVRASRLRLGLFVGAAAIGGLAGALSVQLAGVADPTRSVPQLSVELFVAVLVGGAGWTLGPVVGSAALLAIPPVARWLGDLAGASPERFEPAVAAGLLVGALVLGRRGLVGWAAGRWGRARRSDVSPEAGRERSAIHAEESPEGVERAAGLEQAGAPSPERAVLDLLGVSKRFGGVRAVVGVSLSVRPGEIHALVGPNGSGKSTLLRIAAGTMRADGGTIEIEGRDATSLGPRERLLAGVARMPQGTALAMSLSVLDHVALGATVRRRHAGAFRTLLATPKARAEDREVRDRAAGILARVGLGSKAALPVDRLDAGERRLLMLATVWASEPRAVLLDEPAAGMSVEETERLASAVGDLRRHGVGILLVEHDFPLVLRLADRVTVLDAGRVIALGPPSEVARDPEVVEAYLGTAAGGS
ncbi:MAG TPA: branched-chain amino acid ABC transporter ATP-binding protein/permease [Actinomycetota bacterium]